MMSVSKTFDGYGLVDGVVARRARKEGLLSSSFLVRRENLALMVNVGAAKHTFMINELGFLALDANDARVVFQMFANTARGRAWPSPPDWNSPDGKTFGSDQMKATTINRTVHHS